MADQSSATLSATREDPRRLEALRRYEILDTPPDRAFDDLTELAREICQTPIAAISFVERDRQWFKSQLGLNVAQTPIETAICAHALVEREILEVVDLPGDERFADNLLIREKGLQFYASALLRTKDGLPLGTVFVMDYLSRKLTGTQRHALIAIARQVMAQLELRRSVADLRRTIGPHRFLLQLEAALRPLSDPAEITFTSAKMLGTFLAADRCAYADVEPDEDTFNLTGDYNNGVPSIVGRYTFSQFGDECLRLMRAGQPYVVEDAELDPRAEAVRESYQATLIRAVICVSVMKDGVFTAAMAVHQKTPRRWTADEVELVQSVAGRCWESIERSRAERAVHQLLEAERAARSEAERTSRMKDEFLATLSHELRTPLNAMLGWSQIVTAPDADAETIREGLTTIERNARTQAQIIEDLLDMSRIISGKVRLDVQRLDLAAVLQTAIDTCRPAADAKGLRMQCVLDPHAGPVSGDPNRLQQVFWNLLSNAVKFTPRGGRIQVLLERVNSHVDVSVIDTGVGISEAFLPHVFDRFRQADASTTRAHGGLGLGLAIVKQIVELHGGNVRARSAGQGQGTTMLVTLPVTVVHPEPSQDGERRHPSSGHAAVAIPDMCSALRGLRVLVVDDEPDAQALIRRVLEDCEVAVIVAGTAEEAVRKVEADRPDVLVSDIGMPIEDGYMLIKKVRALGAARGGGVPAVALTAYARVEDRMRAILAGFQMHVAKPVQPAELLTMVASLAGRTMKEAAKTSGKR